MDVLWVALIKSFIRKGIISIIFQSHLTVLAVQNIEHEQEVENVGKLREERYNWVKGDVTQVHWFSLGTYFQAALTLLILHGE